MTQWRYIAQRARTGEFLEWDLPLTRDRLSWALSGAGSLRGTLAPEVGGLEAPDGLPLLDEWGTYIYAEAGGRLRWGGIVIASEYAEGAWYVEAAGFATYPHGLPYEGSYSRIGVRTTDVVRHLWEHVQAQPHGDLGLQLDIEPSPVTVGEPASGDEDADPYELQWWEAPDVGREIDTLCRMGRVEFREEHAWVGDTEQVAHVLRLAYPRLGKRRTDLSFVQGENIIQPVQPERAGEEYANVVVGVGAGEGEAATRVTVPGADEGRLRRAAVYTDKGTRSRRRLRAQARHELGRMARTLEIPFVAVRDHPNARIGSWDLGDDILIDAEVAWLGRVRMWCRVVGWELTSDTTATLELARTDTYTYGG